MLALQNTEKENIMLNQKSKTSSANVYKHISELDKLKISHCSHMVYVKAVKALRLCLQE